MAQERAQKSLVLLLGLLPFLLLEIFLHAARYGTHSFTNLAEQEDLLVRNGEQMVSRFPDNMNLRPFPARKAPGTFRIMLVGDSTMVGQGMRDPETGRRVVVDTGNFLLPLLQQRYPQRRFEVINCGIDGHATYRLRRVVREALQYAPDLIVFQAGSSEYLEARQYKDWAEVKRRHTGFLRHWKTLTLVRSLLRRATVQLDPAPVGYPYPELEGVTQDASQMPVMDVDLVLDDYVVQETLEHSRRNLAEIVASCRAAGVPLLLCTVPFNLRILPHVVAYDLRSRTPHFAEWGPPEKTAELKDISSRAGRLIVEKKLREAQTLTEQAIPRFAGDRRAAILHFLRAEALHGLQRYDEARAAYLQAKDLDPFIWRVLTPFNEAIRGLSSEPGVLVADMEQRVMRAAPNGITDFSQFTDNCHFHPFVYEILAGEVFRVMTEHGLPPAAGK